LIKKKMLLWEKKAFLKGFSVIIGLDEAGRGPLAGPVTAAAVILSPSRGGKFVFPVYRERVDDSKKLLPARREKAYGEILKKSLFGIGSISHRSIDKENIHIAVLRAMRQSVFKVIKEYCRFNVKKERDIREEVCVLVDGKFCPDVPYHTIPIIKGDSKSLSIAAASIVAKVTRDKLMAEYSKLYPKYGFSEHKGYGTVFHLDAIRKYGPCPIHRKSFRPISCVRGRTSERGSTS
jgi:ribonuclease HII